MPTFHRDKEAMWIELKPVTVFALDNNYGWGWVYQKGDYIDIRRII